MKSIYKNDIFEVDSILISCMPFQYITIYHMQTIVNSKNSHTIFQLCAQGSAAVFKNKELFCRIFATIQVRSAQSGGLYNTMDSSITKKINELQKQTRKQSVNALLGQHRKNLRQQLTKFEQEEFNRFYPQIDEANFQQHLPLILKYCYNQNYNYRLVVFSGYLYDYLLEHPQNQEALQILELLSDFQEFEIPQTDQLASILIQNLLKHKKVVLQIVYNLLRLSRYSDCLRDYLIDLQFIEKVDQAIKAREKQHSNQMAECQEELFIGILCSFISTHPLIEENIFKEILQKTLKLIGFNSERIGILLVALSDLVSSINEDDELAELILSSCAGIMAKEYYSYEQEVISLIFYGVRCEIMVDQRYHKLISNSLESNRANVKSTIVVMCEKLIQFDDLSQNYLAMFMSYNFINRFLKVFWHCGLSIKVKILSILKDLAGDLIDIGQEQADEKHCKLDLCEVSSVLKNGLQSSSKELKESSVELILVLLQIVHEQHNQLAVPQYFQQQGVIQLLSTMQMEHDQLFQKIECILQLAKIDE